MLYQIRQIAARAGVVVGLAVLLGATATPIVTVPVDADEGAPLRRLRDFYVPDGLVRYDDEVAELKRRMAEEGLSYDPVNLGVFEVPTVDGPTRFITDRPDDFIVRGVASLLPSDPNLGDHFSINLGPGSPRITGEQDVYEVIPIVSAVPVVHADDVMINPALEDASVGLPGRQGPGEPVRGEVLGDGIADADDDGTDAEWELRREASRCFFVGSEWYERWVCHKVHQQENDDDASHNYWQFHADVSGHSVDRKMEKMWAEVVPLPREGHTQEFDGLPEPKAAFGGQEGCSTRGEAFSISSGAPVQVGYSYYWERETCETYTPKTYGGEHGHWASVWWGNPLANSGAQRHVMLKMPVKTPTADGVTWAILTGQWTRW